MIDFESNKFSYDKELTEKAYEKSVLSFLNEDIKAKCLLKILSSVERHSIHLGIDFQKPWEEIEMEDVYTIEYLFVGELKSLKSYTIDDELVGINIYNERRFGEKEFGTESLLNMTFVINKSKR